MRHDRTHSRAASLCGKLVNVLCVVGLVRSVYVVCFVECAPREGRARDGNWDARRRQLCSSRLIRATLIASIGCPPVARR